MSRQQLAVAIGRSYHTVVSYEHGRATPPLPMLRAVAATLGTSVAYLVGDDGPREVAS